MSSAPSEAAESPKPNPFGVDWDLIDAASILCLDAGIVGLGAWAAEFVGPQYAKFVAGLVRILVLVPVLLYIARKSWNARPSLMGVTLPGAASWRFFVKFALGVGAFYAVCGLAYLLYMRQWASVSPAEVQRHVAAYSAGGRRFVGGVAGGLSFAFLGMVSAPVCEELVFRGILYPALRSKLNVGLAVLVSASIFAGMHLVWSLSLFPPVTQFLGGLIFAYAYERTRSLLFPVFFHAVGNFAILAWNIILANKPDWVLSWLL